MQYSTHNLHPTSHINYGWTGWPSSGPLPALPSPAFLPELSAAWERDSLHLLTHVWEPKQVQLTFAAVPAVSPVLFTQRVKGRLQHDLRAAGSPTSFSRKVTMRSLGHNRSRTVASYVNAQLKHTELADARYRKMLDDAAFSDPRVDFSQPSETNSGRYWYNLHLVLVTANRFRMGGAAFLAKIRESCLQTAAQSDCRLAELSIMPDHLHVALRGSIQMSPKEIGLAFQNSTARVAACRLWQDDFYVGTFSEYDLGALRTN